MVPAPVSAHQRTLTVEAQDAAVEIRSETSAKGSEVDFRFRAVRDGNLPKLVLAVEGETLNRSGEANIELEFRAIFRAVFEFEDANGNGRQDSQEARLSTVPLDTLAFAPMQVTNDSAGGVAGYEVSLEGTLGGFSIGLVSHVFPSEVRMNGTVVSEQSAKVDIAISGYGFTSGTSILGLEIGTESTVQRKTESRDGTDSVETSDGRGTAFFRWESQARVDGRLAPVNAVWQADGDRLFLYYPHGNVIVHDPLLGFELFSSPFPILIAVGVAAAVAVAVGILAYRRKKRR